MIKLNSNDTTSWLNTQDERDDMLHGRNCPPCDGLCNSGRVCPEQSAKEPRIDWVTLGAIVCVLWADLRQAIRKLFPGRSRTQFKRKWLHYLDAYPGVSWLVILAMLIVLLCVVLWLARMVLL